ncbi:hypothetical protein [Terasakiella sp.]|uniref:hypothetical protein n=1 Tax=Terasakiella sp. TaxID=2034861 RepID=UPI003AA7BF17
MVKLTDLKDAYSAAEEFVSRMREAYPNADDQTIRTACTYHVEMVLLELKEK